MKKEPKQVIKEQLRLHEQLPSDFEDVKRKQKYFFQEVKYKAELPHGANYATLQFLKESSIPGYQTHAITFIDNAGILWWLFCLVVQDALGNWHIEGCSGIGDDGKMSLMQLKHLHIFLYLGDTNHFYSGGLVRGPGCDDITKVRLLTDEKLIAEDIVQDSLVTFVTDQKNIQRPIIAELYNHNNELIKTIRK